LFTAVFTEAADDLMLEIDAKIVFIAQGFFHRPEKHFITVHAFPAFYTNQVMVMPFFSVMVYYMVAGFAF
jgi:hypothetical protein